MVATFGLTAEEVDEDHVEFINEVLGKINKGKFAEHLADRLPSDFWCRKYSTSGIIPFIDDTEEPSDTNANCQIT